MGLARNGHAACTRHELTPPCRHPQPLALLACLHAPRALGLPCADGCAQHGTCNEELGRCDCPKHRDGPSCGRELSLTELASRCRSLAFQGVESCVSNANACLMGCHGRGECVAGFCHCKPGAGL